MRCVLELAKHKQVALAWLFIYEGGVTPLGPQMSSLQAMLVSTCRNEPATVQVLAILSISHARHVHAHEPCVQGIHW